MLKSSCCLRTRILALFVLSLILATPTLAQDKVGVYWDGASSQNVGTTAATPGSTTGYLVLQDASNTSGVLGWEACFDINGPGVFAGWTFPGDAVNAGTDPCYAVGYTSPLPYSANIVLGSFIFVATDVGPITISMEPDWFASLPGEMSYIPGDDPGALIAMTTATGRPEVAGLNGANPLVSVSHELLDLGGTVVGNSISGFLTITNDSDLAFELDVSLQDLCISFSLPGGGGPLTVPPHSAQNIEVVFTPIVDRQVFCDLDLGPNLNPIQVTGTGALLVTSWTVSGGPDFGWVTVGQSKTIDITVRNTGETSFDIEVAMPDSCGDFSMVFGGGTFTINPNGTLKIPVVFAPTVVGYQQCQLLLGNNPVPNYWIWGTGIEPTPLWDAPLSHDFGTVSTGQAVTTAITVTNTGTLTFDLAASLPDSCPEFTITQGSNPVTLLPGFSHSMVVQFLSPLPGTFQCPLDMGPVVWDIPLTAVATPGPGSIQVLPSPITFPLTVEGLSNELDVSLTNLAGHDVDLDLSVLPTNGAFSFVSGAGPVTLNPDSLTTVRLRFAPPVQGEHTGSLELGSPYGSVPMAGPATDSTPICLIEPASYLSFGNVALDSTATQVFAITNVGAVPMTIAPSSDSPHYLISAPPEVLQPGEMSNLSVTFQPLTGGSLSGTISSGVNSCGGVAVNGFGIVPAEWVTIAPDSLNFPLVVVGNSFEIQAVMTNVGPMNLDLFPSILLPQTGFSVAQGGGLATLAPGASHTVSVAFSPAFEDTFESRLSFGPGIPPVPLQAHSVYVAPDCQVSASDVNFGQLAVGSTDTRLVVVTNNSAGDIVISPSSSSPIFEVSSAPVTIGPGATTALQILFRPTQVLPYTGTVSLGNGACADINCFGQGIPGGATNQDVLGIFWDTGYTQTLTGVTTPNSVVPGHLVLSNPSTSGGVSGWECAVEFTGPSIIVSWTLQGNAINLGSDNEFIVGLDAPLPYTDQALLADFQVLVLSLNSPTNFNVVPLRFGSVPDQMSWIPGSNPEALLRMNPNVIGTNLVATIEPAILTGVELPVAVTQLLPNVPNPFNPMTEIRFELASPQQVSLRIYDVTGRLVRELESGSLVAGPHARVWQGRDSSGRQAPSGAYYVRLVTEDKIENLKIMLLK